MPIELPTNEDGSLRRFTAEEYYAMDIRRRGVSGEGDHWEADFGPDGSGCTRKFSCAYDQRFNAVIYFVGAAKIWVDGEQSKISRLLPQRDPDNPQWIATKCRVTEFRFDGEIDYSEDEWVLNEDDEWELIEDEAPTVEPGARFTRAELQVTYELVPYELRTDGETTNEKNRYVTYEGYPGAEVTVSTNYIGLPGSILHYTTPTGLGVPSGVPIPFAVGFVEGMSQFKIIWRRVPKDAWGPGTPLTQRVLGNGADDPGMVGSLNQTGFDGYAALSLQLIGVEQRLMPDPTGLDYSWDLAYLFSYAPKKYGHLGFYFHDVPDVPTGNAGNKSGYYQVLRPAYGEASIDAGDLLDGESLFVVRDFNGLFEISNV